MRFVAAIAVLACVLWPSAFAPEVVRGVRAAAPANPAPAAAQPTQDADGPAGAITVVELDALLAAADPEGPAAEAYRRAIEQLRVAQTLRAQAGEFRAAAGGAADRLAAIRVELEQPAAEVVIDLDAEAPLAEFERGEAQALADLGAARGRVVELEAEAERRENRQRAIPELLAGARQRLAEVRERLKAEAAAAPPAPNGAGSELASDPRAALLHADAAAVEAEVDVLEAELASYDATRDLLQARRDRASRRVADLERTVEAWRSAVASARQRGAARTAADAERLGQQAAEQHPVLSEYADENRDLAAQLDADARVPAGVRRAERRLIDTAERLTEIRRRYRALKARLDALSVNRATGLLLRQQYEALEDLTAIRRDAVRTRELLEEAEYVLIERREERDGLRDAEAATERLLSRVDADGAEREAMEPVARALVNARRDILTELVADAARYTETLYQLDDADRQLLEASRGYRAFIRERILWVRSLPPDRWPRLNDFSDFTGWILSTDAWQQTGRSTGNWAATRWPIVVLLVGLLLLTSLSQRFARAELKRIAERVRRFRTDSLRETLRAFALTLLLSVPFGLLLWVIGWALLSPADQTGLGIALGRGFAGAGVVYAAVMFLVQVARPGGLAEAHFRWPVAATTLLRRHARWLSFVLAPCLGVLAIADASPVDGSTATVGRLAFTIAMIAGAVFIFRTLKPTGPVLGTYTARSTGAWLARTTAIWFWGLLAAPVALIVVAWLGYAYTAFNLGWNLGVTVGFVFVVVVGNGLLLRWLFLVRRRVAIEDAKRRRDQAAEGRATTEDAGPTETSAAAIEEDKVNLPAISAQATQLIRTTTVVAALIGLFAIWSDVLPALRMLDRVQVYPSVRLVEVDDVRGVPVLERLTAGVLAPPAAASPTLPPEADAQPATQPAPSAPTPTAIPGLPSLSTSVAANDTSTATQEQPPVVVTLGHIVLAIVVLVATVLAFRNLPGLVEMLVLQRLPLDAGSRYALATVLRYSIGILGVILAFGAVNISWSNVQWLAAALTFGLAFGLQEIFANFVSGLIILAERPIRIGDTVTVQNITGTVTRIRMRATTITDWDRKELIIPNKSFITGDVINWTLSDPVLRLIIPVGISYSADVNKAERLLLEIAEGHENVLKDPKPYVNFTRFGDSTLDFELRLFLPHIDHLLTVRHALHMKIIETFRRESIEIAFPQRDLHIRSIGELSDLVKRRSDLNDPAE